MFLQALQFQQQQAAQNQAASYASMYGQAPAGNYMLWNQPGGPTQPTPGADTLQALAQAFSMGTGAAGLTGQYNAPTQWQYQPGQYVYNSETGQMGQIQGGGQLLVLPSEPQGVNPASVPNVDSFNFNLLQQGQGQATQTQQATQNAYQNAATAAGVTGLYNQPMGNIAQDAFNRAGPQTQQAYLNQYQGSTQEAMQHYWADVQGAIQQSGQTPEQFVYGTNGPQASMALQSMYGTYGLPKTGQETLQDIAQQNQIAQQWANLYGYTPSFDANGNPVAPGGNAQTLAAQNQQAQLSGMYQGAPTETAREFNLTNALQQGQLGQQYLATAAQLQGPQNTFQLSNYLRGAQGNPNVPTYLNALANNMGMAPFQGTGSTVPTPQSAAGLAGQLGGTQSATPGWDYNQTLGAIQNIMSNGAQKLGPGALERLTPDELSAFGSGIGAAGGSMPSFLQQYAQSRVGQQGVAAPTAFGG